MEIVRIRATILNALHHGAKVSCRRIPPNFVYANPTIRALGEYVMKIVLQGHGLVPGGLLSDRIVEVEWAKSEKEEIQSVRILATTENRTGMLAGITNAIAEIKTGIRDARANVSRDDRGLIEVTVEVFDKKHLDKVISSIEQVPGVIDVERVNS